MNERDVFEAALELPPENRVSYLDDACGGDGALRGRLAALLGKHEQAGSFLESPAVPALPTIDEPAVSERPGTLIGPYKLLEQIGEGGMGLVFVAEQQKPVHRKVALKVIKPGMDTRQIVARFEAERQALALMDHPHIAKVLDGGETAGGRPYFVMELVKGMPITDYCDENRLTPRERLELFLQVCQAVQHAHQKGIIHRDLKPSNVLVAAHDGVPVVKIIDFGVAKAVGQRLTERTLYTQSSQLIGTPLYMPPEQAGQSALDVDTRSDIYSLGVLLYELLSGTTPFEKKRFEEAGYDEIRRIIREEEPPKPSTRITTLGKAATTVSTQRRSDPKRLSHLFRGELDWIVMKCLEKDRNRRYETTSALAADVQRYLNNEPVLACPPSASYKFRKFAQRQKRALAMAACLLLALAGMAGVMGWAVRDRQARETALDGEADRAVEEAEALIGDGKCPEALVVIQRAEKLLAAAGRQGFPERFQELNQDLTMASRLEEIYSQPGRHREVHALQLELIWPQRLEIHIQPQKEEIFIGHEAATEYSQAFQDYGIDVTAFPVEEAARRIRARSIRLELARALDIWSSIRRRAGNQGAPEWKQLLDVARAADPDPWRDQLRKGLQRDDRKALEALAASADVRRLPPGTLHLLGYTLAGHLGAPEQAVSLLTKAQRQYPEDLWINEALGWCCYSKLRPPQYDEAVRFYTAARTVRPNSPYITNSLARALLDKGSLPEAVAEFTKAIEIKPDYDEAWFLRGNANLHLGRWDQAQGDYSKAIQLEPRRRAAWANRGLAYGWLGRWDQAQGDYSKAIQLEPRWPAAWNNRGIAYGRLGRWDLAIADFTKAIQLDPNRNRNAWNNRGNAHRTLEHWDLALADFSKAAELDPKHWRAWTNRGEIYAYLGQWDKAAADFSRLLELEPNNQWRWYQAAALWLQIGNRRDYRRACHEMLERFGKTGSANVAEQTAKTCLLAPDAVPDLETVQKLASFAFKENGSDRWMLLTKALAEYRAGRFPKSIECLQRVAPKTGGGSLDAMAFALLAMGRQRQGQAKEARAALDQAQAILEHRQPRPERGQRFGDDWHDWLRSQILCREAESLLGTEDKNTSQGKRGY